MEWSHVQTILVAVVVLVTLSQQVNARSDAQASTSSPNILFFVIDDLGWGDLAFSGLPTDRTAGGHAEYTTPNLDKFAQEGVLLNHYYVNQLCSPTRTSMLASRYAYNLGLAGGVITNGFPVGLKLNESTIANHLKDLGYRTFAFGKWDAGYHTIHHTPTQRGFDEFKGYYNADEDYFTHYTGGCDCPVKGLDFHHDVAGTLHPFWDNTTYSAYLYTEAVMDVLMSTTETSTPFFIYAAFQSVHGPLESPPQFMAECVKEGVMEMDRTVFCGMVKALDEGVGNITRALYAQNLDQNTLVVLTTDNGGQNFVGGNNWPLRGNKATVFEGGVRGQGFVWGAMLNKQHGQTSGRLSSVLMHCTDWGPTLVSAAGGDGTALANNKSLLLDGVDQWGALSLIPGLNTTSPRTEILLHLEGPINNDASQWQSQHSSLRMGDYKIIVNMQESPCMNGNTSGQHCLKEATGWVHINGSGRYYRKPDANQTCDQVPCLFNLVDDPLEETNLYFSQNPEDNAALTRLLQRLHEWNATRVPDVKFPCDPLSCCTHFDGVFMPWLNSTPPMPPVPPPAVAVRSSMSASTAWAKKGSVVPTGWVCDNTVLAKVDVPSNVTIRINGEVVALSLANTFRSKLVSTNNCKDNYHGFVQHLDPSLFSKGKDVVKFSIVVRSTGEEYNINDSPQCVCNGVGCSC